MKNLILFFTLSSLVACSSAPTEPEQTTTSTDISASSDEELPKARSPKPGTSLKTVSETIEAPNKRSLDETTASGKPCNTPLGEIPHGGQLTGYVQPKVSADEICVSDTVRCNDGVWKGQGIYPKCVKEKASTTK